MGEEEKLLHGELSYDIVGACFDAFDEVGPNHKEIVYQRVVAGHLAKRNICHKEQVEHRQLCTGGTTVIYRFDFVVDGKVVLELKAGGRFHRSDYQQVKGYLVQSGLKLGILVRFGEDGVVFQRILRPYASPEPM